MARNDYPTSVSDLVRRLRHGAIVGSILLAAAMAFGTALSWPAASAAQTHLVQLHGKARPLIVSLKVNSFTWACGLYTLPSVPNRWRFVETKSGFWGEADPDNWRRGPLNGHGEPKWENCMKHTHYSRRPGRSANNYYAMNDWLALQLIHMFG